MVYASNMDYVGRYFHMTKLWPQDVFIIPAITTFCKRGFSIQNHIKSILWCSLVLETYENCNGNIEAIDFKQVWIK